MSTVVDAQVITRRGATVHEDVGEQFNRLSGELWKEYDEKIRVREESRYERTGWLTLSYYPDENQVSVFRTFRNAEIHNTVPSSWREYFEVIVEDSVERGREFRDFDKYLYTLGVVSFCIATRATTQTSTPLVQAGYLGTVSHSENQRLLETGWTDEKNRRRCDLVDKEIDSTLSPVEQQELEELQAEMLAYRRAVAPLPLKELRELHQGLLRGATDHRT